MKVPRSTDRRVLRTHRTLREALISLILERGWDEISVRHVCERADVGRSTFYTHFADKEDLLVSGFDELRKVLRELATRRSAGALGFVGGMIEHVQGHRRLFRAVVGTRSGQVVQKRFRQILVDLVDEDLARLAPVSPQRDAAVHYVAGALFALLIWWLESSNRLQSSDLEELFHRLTTPVLGALKRDR